MTLGFRIPRTRKAIAMSAVDSPGRRACSTTSRLSRGQTVTQSRPVCRGRRDHWGAPNILAESADFDGKPGGEPAVTSFVPLALPPGNAFSPLSSLRLRTRSRYNPPMAFDGSKLARVRKAAGMTQADLAAAVGRNRVTISDIETGKLRPGADLAQLIAGALSVAPDDLQATASPPDGQADHPNPTAQECQLVTLFRALDPVQRAQLLGFALGLAAQDDPAETD